MLLVQVHMLLVISCMWFALKVETLQSQNVNITDYIYIFPSPRNRIFIHVKPS